MPQWKIPRARTLTQCSQINESFFKNNLKKSVQKRKLIPFQTKYAYLFSWSCTAAKSLQSCPTLCDPIDGSPPGSTRPWDSPGKNTGVGCHFLLQCVKVKSLSHVQLFATPWTAAYQAPPSMGFSRQEYWSGSPLPSPVDHVYLSFMGEWAKKSRIVYCFISSLHPFWKFSPFSVLKLVSLVSCRDMTPSCLTFLPSQSKSF